MSVYVCECARVRAWSCVKCSIKHKSLLKMIGRASKPLTGDCDILCVLLFSSGESIRLSYIINVTQIAVTLICKKAKNDIQYTASRRYIVPFSTSRLTQKHLAST